MANNPLTVMIISFFSRANKKTIRNGSLLQENILKFARKDLTTLLHPLEYAIYLQNAHFLLKKNKFFTWINFDFNKNKKYNL